MLNCCEGETKCIIKEPAEESESNAQNREHLVCFTSCWRDNNNPMAVDL